MFHAAAHNLKKWQLKANACVSFSERTAGAGRCCCGDQEQHGNCCIATQSRHNDCAFRGTASGVELGMLL